MYSSNVFNHYISHCKVSTASSSVETEDAEDAVFEGGIIVLYLLTTIPNDYDLSLNASNTPLLFGVSYSGFFFLKISRKFFLVPD